MSDTKLKIRFLIVFVLAMGLLVASMSAFEAGAGGLLLLVGALFVAASRRRKGHAN
jgi:hypothetical protein